MCPTYKRRKSLIVSDQTIQAEGLGNFFSSLGKAAKMLEIFFFENSLEEH